MVLTENFVASQQARRELRATFSYPIPVLQVQGAAQVPWLESRPAFAEQGETIRQLQKGNATLSSDAIFKHQHGIAPPTRSTWKGSCTRMYEMPDAPVATSGTVELPCCGLAALTLKRSRIRDGGSASGLAMPADASTSKARGGDSKRPLAVAIVSALLASLRRGSSSCNKYSGVQTKTGCMKAEAGSTKRFGLSGRCISPSSQSVCQKNNRGGAGPVHVCRICGEPRKGTHRRTGFPNQQ